MCIQINTQNSTFFTDTYDGDKYQGLEQCAIQFIRHGLSEEQECEITYCIVRPREEEGWREREALGICDYLTTLEPEVSVRQRQASTRTHNIPIH